MNKILKLLIWTFILFFLLLIVSAISLSLGSVEISLKDFLFALKNKNSIEHDILIKTRMPRILLGLAIGGSLSICGAILQAIFKNPLVEPYTLGISGGAGLGVSIAVFFKINLLFSGLTVTLSGFLGAMMICLILFVIKMKSGFKNINQILLTGVMLSFICSSMILFIMAVSSSMDLQAIVYWIMGSLDEPDINLIYITLISSVIILFVSFLFTRHLNALQLGEEEALNLGIKTEKVKKILFVLTSIITGLSVSVAGIIGFVGLIVPHFVRLLISRDYRLILILSFLSGAIFLIICDTIARTVISPIELPVGVITGIFGGLLFINTLMKRQRDL
ncbi:MAG: iron ABC transporter permease [Spirochaetes bacterium]|nr:iron ABC transporter permease [Spirochaetota bacterium]